jgi:hypothetical protein
MTPSATLTAPASQQAGTGTAARANGRRFDLRPRSCCMGLLGRYG